MWNSYFDGQCNIYAVDINPECKKFENEFPNVKIFIGNQGSDEFLNFVKTQVPSIDIFIDDGSHMNSHIIKTFETLYPNISLDGTYLIEDLHTSYWAEYGGGLNTAGTAIEHLKTLIDKLNAKHISRTIPRKFIWEKDSVIKADTSFSNITNSLHFYDSVAVIEKHKSYQPHVEATIR
jgi:hypothetical protein